MKQTNAKQNRLSQKPQLEKKGKGQSIIVSAFLTFEWGLLRHEDE